ncbi:MAG TPA: hypothetical protein VJ755_11290 [Gemmatimonadales bacterium]|nr:hypothetical protein [Gemmatimonadales bacterium]
MVRTVKAIVLVALGASSPTLVAQAPTPDSTSKASFQAQSPHAIGFGFFATLGSYWQIEAIEVGYVRTMSRGLAAFSLTGRVGTFIDETAVMGGSRGMVFATTLATRTRMKRIAQLGEDERGTAIGLDVTLEASGYLASGSPFAQGSRWGAIALLPGLRIGKAAIVIGPTAFFAGGTTSVRGLLAFRGEATLARRERQP